MTLFFFWAAQRKNHLLPHYNLRMFKYTHPFSDVTIYSLLRYVIPVVFNLYIMETHDVQNIWCVFDSIMHHLPV